MLFLFQLKEYIDINDNGISNIYLKAAIEKSWHPENIDFLSLKSLQVSFLGGPTPADIIEFSNF